MQLIINPGDDLRIINNAKGVGKWRFWQVIAKKNGTLQLKEEI